MMWFPLTSLVTTGKNGCIYVFLVIYFGAYSHYFFLWLVSYIIIVLIRFPNETFVSLLHMRMGSTFLFNLLCMV